MKKKKHHLPQSIEILDKICIDVFTRNPPDNRILKMPSRAIASSEFCFFENLISHVHNMVNKYNCRLCHSFVHIYIYLYLYIYNLFLNNQRKKTCGTVYKNFHIIVSLSSDDTTLSKNIFLLLSKKKLRYSIY